MNKIYVTGDCHAEFSKFNTSNFPEQKELTRDDFVIVCGDFGGVWCDTPQERYWLDWLSKKNFTILFVDGNHENFDRLFSGEFEIVEFHGGYAHKIRDNIYHLFRGEIYELCGKKIFAFGGASSHDIQDGILQPDDYKTTSDLVKAYNKLTKQGKMVRINHISWWEDEVSTAEEEKHGLASLEENDYKVDFIITHCCPQHIVSEFSHGMYKPEEMTVYFDEIAERTTFSKWYFGHYHGDKAINDKYIMMYKDIVQIA